MVVELGEDGSGDCGKRYGIGLMIDTRDYWRMIGMPLLTIGDTSGFRTKGNHRRSGLVLVIY
jgi:hypothetical protein